MQDKLIKELFAVYHGLSARKQSEMIFEFHKLSEAAVDEPSRKFFAKLIEVLEKEKKENV